MLQQKLLIRSNGVEASKNDPNRDTQVLDEKYAWPNQLLLHFWQSSETTPDLLLGWQH